MTTPSGTASDPWDATVQYPPIVFTMAAPNAVVRLGAGFDSIRGGFKGTYFKLQQDWIDDGSGLAANMLNSKLASFPPDQQSAIQEQMATNITQGVAMGAPPASLIAGPAGGDGVYLTTSTTLIQKHSDMLDSLNISGSIAISMDAVGNLSGSASYLKEDVQASTSMYFLIKVSIRKSWLYIKDEELVLDKTDLADVLEQDFVKKHGDCFVNGILTGGDFFALIKSELGSESKKENIAGELQGKLQEGAISGQAEVNLKKNLESVSTSSSLNLSFVTSGGKPSSSPQTIDDLYAAATTFIKDCQDHPVPIEISLMPYGMLRSYRPTVFRKPTSGVGAFLIQAKAELLGLLMDRYYICLNIRNIALDMAKDPLLFNNYKIRGLHDAAMDQPAGVDKDGNPVPSNQAIMVANIKQVMKDVQDEQSRIVRFLVAEDSNKTSDKAQGDSASDAIVSVTDLWPGAPDTTASAFYAEFMQRLPIRKDQSDDVVYWNNVQCGYLSLPIDDKEKTWLKFLADVKLQDTNTDIGHQYTVTFDTSFPKGTGVRIFLGFSGISADLISGKKSTGVAIKALDINEDGFTLQVDFDQSTMDPTKDRLVVTYLALPDPDPRATLPFRMSSATFSDLKPADWKVPKPQASSSSIPALQDPSQLPVLTVDQNFPPGMGSPTILLAPTAITDAADGMKFVLTSQKKDPPSTQFTVSLGSVHSSLSNLAVNWLALPSTASPSEQSAWRYNVISLPNDTNKLTESTLPADKRGLALWKETTVDVNFDKNGGRLGGNKVPLVFVAITSIQLNQDGVHVKAYPEDGSITYEGFKLVVQTWKCWPRPTPPSSSNPPPASPVPAPVQTLEPELLTISYLVLADYVR